MADEFGATVQLARPDISVPGTGTSLDIIANYIRVFLQRPNEQIHGEITKTGAQVELHLRFGSWSASYPEVINSYPKPDDLGSAVGRLLKAAALGLTEQTNPDIAAAVYLNRKAPAQAAAMVARALSREPVDDAALAYCLWAELDIEQQGATPIAVQQAVRKYQAALKIKPDMPEIY